MKTKAQCASQTSRSSRILTIAGAVGMLFTLPVNAQPEVARHITDATFLPAPIEVSNEIFSTKPSFALGIPPAPANDSASNSKDKSIGTTNLSLSASGPVLHQEIAPPLDTTHLLPAGLFSNPVVPDSGATGFVAARAFPDLTTIPAQTVLTPLLNPKLLVLQEPRTEALNRYDPAGLKQERRFLRDVAVRFFVPVSKPAAPGQGHDLVARESDRPWPVIAAGAAAGRCWNDPGLYQPQNYLSFNW